MIPAEGGEPPTASPEASGSDLPRLIEPEAEAGDQGEAQAADEAPFETLQSELAKWVAIDPPIEEPDDDEPQAMPNPAPAEPSTDAPLAAESPPRAEGVADGEAETGTDDQASEAEGPSTLPGLDPGAEIEESQWLDLTLAKADAVLIRLHKEAKAAPGDSELAAALYEPQAWNAGATVWHECKYAVNPQQAARASAAQARHRLTLEALLGKDAKTYEQSLKRLAEALRLRLKAKAALETEATLEAKASNLAEALDRMSRQVAVAMIRNKTRVVEIDPPPPRTKGNPSPPILRAMAKQDFFDLYAHERYPVGDDQVSVAKVWFASEGRQTYKKGVGFDPSHVGTRPGAEVLNLFWGFACEPLPPDPSIDPYAGEGWSILRAHMLDNMASGDLKGFKYVLHWYADIRQNPADKKGTALVFRGPQGAGKSIISEIFGCLFGAHDHYVSKTDGVTGSFNEALFGRLHVTVEEAVWAGDRVAEGVLKDLKTNSRININPKGIAAFGAANHARFVIIGNPKWIIAAPEDDRRDTVFRFASGNLGKTKAFAAMAEMENGGYRALMRDLLAIDLKAENAPELRQPYVTAELIEQKELSMPTERAWLKDLLRRGEVMHPYEGLRPNLVPLDALMADYRDYAGKIGDRGRKSDESLIGKMLKEIFGKELGSRWRAHAVKRLEKNEDGTFETASVRVWCRNFPSLQRSRQLFLKFYGAEAHADWFDDENQEWEIRAIYFTNR